MDSNILQKVYNWMSYRRARENRRRRVQGIPPLPDLRAGPRTWTTNRTGNLPPPPPPTGDKRAPRRLDVDSDGYPIMPELQYWKLGIRRAILRSYICLIWSECTWPHDNVAGLLFS